MFFDPMYFLFLAPALILALWAQMRVKSTYHAAQQEPAQLSGAAAARHMLDSAGLQDVAIEPIPGELSDHYDPRAKVLRLSQ
jgi:Zn-dependent membrane protease YugP